MLLEDVIKHYKGDLIKGQKRESWSIDGKYGFQKIKGNFIYDGSEFSIFTNERQGVSSQKEAVYYSLSFKKNTKLKLIVSLKSSFYRFFKKRNKYHITGTDSLVKKLMLDNEFKVLIEKEDCHIILENNIHSISLVSLLEISNINQVENAILILKKIEQKII